MQHEEHATHACACAVAQSPPKGKHRYLFLLFKQHNRVKSKSPKTRQNFAIHGFMKVGVSGAGQTATAWLCYPESKGDRLLAGITHPVETVFCPERSILVQDHGLSDPAAAVFFYSSPE